MNDQIICPKCGESISITDAMSYQFKEKLLKEGQEQGKKTLSGELEYLKSQNLKKDQELEVTRRESLELRKEKDRLDEDKKAWELQKMRDLEQAKDEIRKKAIAAVIVSGLTGWIDTALWSVMSKSFSGWRQPSLHSC